MNNLELNTSVAFLNYIVQFEPKCLFSNQINQIDSELGKIKKYGNYRTNNAILISKIEDLLKEYSELLYKKGTELYRRSHMCPYSNDKIDFYELKYFYNKILQVVYGKKIKNTQKSHYFLNNYELRKYEYIFRKYKQGDYNDSPLKDDISNEITKINKLYEEHLNFNVEKDLINMFIQKNESRRNNKANPSLERMENNEILFLLNDTLLFVQELDNVSEEDIHVAEQIVTTFHNYKNTDSVKYITYYCILHKLIFFLNKYHPNEEQKKYIKTISEQVRRKAKNGHKTIKKFLDKINRLLTSDINDTRPLYSSLQQTSTMNDLNDKDMQDVLDILNEDNDPDEQDMLNRLVSQDDSTLPQHHQTSSQQNKRRSSMSNVPQSSKQPRLTTQPVRRQAWQDPALTPTSRHDFMNTIFAPSPLMLPSQSNIPPPPPPVRRQAWQALTPARNDLIDFLNYRPPPTTQSKSSNNHQQGNAFGLSRHAMTKYRFHPSFIPWFQRTSKQTKQAFKKIYKKYHLSM